jgi:SAM-dependent MidA family methyltransferase
VKIPLPENAIRHALGHAVPLPDADALAHSAACTAMIQREIATAGGWISFARFMALVLYAPGLGYYAAGARKFGAAGDFVTAPEISVLFGQCIARAVAESIRATRGDVLELGPGSGKLACDMLRELASIDALPGRYFLLEVSADLRERQQQAIATLPPHLASRAVWLDTLPATFSGAIVANEVLDVLPVHLVQFSGARAAERGVGVDEFGDFIWIDKSPLPDELERLKPRVNGGVPGMSVAVGDYLTEFSPAVAAWVSSLAHTLTHGVMLLIDYGFRRAEYYHESRSTGTLMCHYRHHAHTDPFLYPGLQDITAHVDFTDVAEAGIAAGLTLEGYTSQAQFLLAAGIADLLSTYSPDDAATYLPITNQAQRLLSPAEMGEFFKVIGFSRGNCGLAAFNQARPLPL